MNSVRGIKVLWGVVTGLIAVLIVVALSGIVGFSQGVDDKALSFLDAPGSPIEVEGAWSAVIGDFNEDGHLDIAVLCPFFYSPEHTYIEEGGTAAVGILCGNGDGTFQGPTYFRVGEKSWGPGRIATGDFNDDGHLDLTITNVRSLGFASFPSDVYVLFGDGHGRFQPAPDSPFDAGYGAASMIIGDFPPEDGDQDLAVACAAEIDVLRSDGAGGILSRSVYRLTFDTGAVGIVADDFNEDGHLDLATSNINNDTVLVMLTRDGIFAKTAYYDLPQNSRPHYLVMGDFNEDGQLDLAVAGLGIDVGGYVYKSHVYILFGKGQGKFAKPIQVEINGDDPMRIATADLNMDGHLDLVTANDNSGDLSILLGDGQGGFRLATCSPISIVSPPGTRWVGIGDFNEDGRPDLVTLSDYDDFIIIKLNKD